MCRKNGKDDGNIACQGSLQDPCSRLHGHMFKMSCLPTNHRSQTDNGIKTARLRKSLCHQGKLEGSRNPKKDTLRPLITRKDPLRTPHKTVDNLLVETRRH